MILRKFCMIKYLPILLIFYLKINVVFRKGYNSQHCIVAMIEKWKKSLASKGTFGALLTDLSKAFNCMLHELMIAKLDAYGFDLKYLILVFNYLHKRKQRVEINCSYSDWSDLLCGSISPRVHFRTIIICYIHM